MDGAEPNIAAWADCDIQVYIYLVDFVSGNLSSSASLFSFPLPFRILELSRFMLEYKDPSLDCLNMCIL